MGPIEIMQQRSGLVATEARPLTENDVEQRAIDAMYSRIDGQRELTSERVLAIMETERAKDLGER